MKRPDRAHGVPFLLLTLALLFLFTPVRIVRIVALFYLLALFFAWLYARLVPRAISVERVQETVHGIKLQAIELELTVRNRSAVPISLFTVTDVAGGLFVTSPSMTLSLGAGETRTVSYGAQGRTRGAFELGPVTLGGRDPFGLLAWQRRIELPGRAVIYPTIHRMHLSYRHGIPTGTLAAKDMRYEDVTQFRSVREYVPGDDLRRINWKVSAKNNKLFTTEFDATLSVPVVVVLNFSRDDYPRRQRESLLERGAELAASVPFFYGGLQQHMAFIATGVDNASGDHFPVRAAGSGFEHAQSILELVATMSPRDGHANFSQVLLTSGLAVPTGARVVIVSPPLHPEQADVLISLRRRGTNVLLLQIDSHLERSVDDVVRASFPVVSIRSIGSELLHD
jgi:uncharacterized protein (DUF58 family)